MTAPSMVPRNDAVEVAVLGACLQDNEAMVKAMAIVSANDFFTDRHREIFRTIETLAAQGETVDVLAVGTDLQRRLGDRFLEIGSAYLASLVDNVPSTANVESHAKIVKECAALRRLHDLCTRTAEHIGSNNVNVETLLSDVRRDLDGIDPSGADHGARWVCLADVPPERLTWLWDRRIPRGKVSLLIGDPGQGKSSVLIDLTARISTGSVFPDGTPAPQGDVVILTAEDALADTVRPRLDAAEGNPGRVHALEAMRGKGGQRTFDLTRDLPALEAKIVKEQAVLVVIDPLSAYLGSKTDSHRDVELRGALAPLAALAERTGAAIVGIMHMTKNQQMRAIYRAQGNVAFVAAARAVFAVTADPTDPERRFLLPVKTNLTRKPQGLAYRLVEAGDVARVEWDDEPVDVDVESALMGLAAVPVKSERDEAKDFLRTVLADGPVMANTVMEQARAAGIAERTLNRAKAALGVISEKQGSGREWWWRLPLKAASPAAQASGGSLGNHGTLRKAEDPQNGHGTPKDAKGAKDATPCAPDHPGNLALEEALVEFVL